MDPRYAQLAEVLTGFSTNLKKGEKVLVDVADIPDEMTVAIIRAARARGAEVQTVVGHSRVTREILREGSDAQFALTNEVELFRMKKMDAYIAVRGSNNIFESGDVPSDRMNAYAKAIRPTMNQRIGKSKWVVLRWPTSAMAQQARMSTEQFEDFYFRVCTMDHARMVPGMKALAETMMAADRVHITGPGTDLKFSIKGIPAIPCTGEFNIPDGEVFTAPVKDSVEGVIQYNAPTIYQGVSFENIRLVFKKGKIVEATSNNTKRLNEILDTDAGARHIGRNSRSVSTRIS